MSFTLFCYTCFVNYVYTYSKLHQTPLTISVSTVGRISKNFRGGEESVTSAHVFTISVALPSSLSSKSPSGTMSSLPEQLPLAVVLEQVRWPWIPVFFRARVYLTLISDVFACYRLLSWYLFPFSTFLKKRATPLFFWPPWFLMKKSPSFKALFEVMHRFNLAHLNICFGRVFSSLTLILLGWPVSGFLSFSMPFSLIPVTLFCYRVHPASFSFRQSSPGGFVTTVGARASEAPHTPACAPWGSWPWAEKLVL